MSAFNDWYTDDIDGWCELSDRNEIAEKGFNAGMERAAGVITSPGYMLSTDCHSRYLLNAADAIREEIKE